MSGLHDRIRVALIGCGAVARLYYMPALRELETAGSLEVVALLDPVARHAALLREAIPIAVAIDELVLIWAATEAEEWINRLVWIPI